MFYMSYVLCFFSENCPQKPLVYSWVICQSGTWLIKYKYKEIKGLSKYKSKLRTI